MYNLFADTNTRMVDVETEAGKKLEPITAEQAIDWVDRGVVSDMTLKTQRLIHDFEGDWDELDAFYKEVDG